MRLHLLLIFWFVLTAWSGHVGATAMAHCQTHERTGTQVVNELPPEAQNQANSHALKHDQLLLALQLSVDTAHPSDHVNDCCDHSTEHHQCSGNCVNCDGCSTAHGAAIPAVLMMASTIARPKILYFDDFYLRSPGSSQERPPKH